MSVQSFFNIETKTKKQTLMDLRGSTISKCHLSYACVSVLVCLSREMSLSEREARARLHRLALVDMSVKHKARVQ